MAKFGIGQGVSRVEDRRLLTGAGRYADDLRLAGAVHAYIVRSPYAHAEIKTIDVAASRARPGVLAVLTGEDVAADGLGGIRCRAELESRDGRPRGDTDWAVLARRRVRYVGEAVALVVAETAAIARDAAEAVAVDYAPLPATVEAVAAVRDGAPLVWDAMQRNVCFDWVQGDAEAVAAAFDAAANIVELELTNNRLVANPMEPRAALAEFDPATGRTTLHTPCQGPRLLRDQLAEDIFKTDAAEFRVACGDVGGGFGSRIFLYPEQVLVVWAARRLRRSVRWTADRSETFLADIQGRDHVTTAQLALDAEGRFTALDVVTHANLGAYLSSFAPFVATGAGVPMLAGLYRLPAIHVNVIGVMTNTVPVDAYRGAGRPEAIFVIERLVDKAARTLNIAPDDLRRRNFIRPEDLPYETALGSTYDSGDFAAAMQAAMANAGWATFAGRREAARTSGRLRGLGMASYVEKCGGGNAETAIVRFNDDDTVSVMIGNQSNGQGHETAYSQIMSARLGIDAERIRIVQGDTDIVPAGLTGGSRAIAVGGVAVARAAEAIIDKGRRIAAHLLETAVEDIVYDEGAFRIAGTDRVLTLFETARAAADSARLPADMDPGLDVTYAHEPAAATYPNGCHICELEIDPATGAVEIIAYTAVDDFGDTINPTLLAGQVHGGIAQGIGQALLEHARYDSETGQLLTGSFMDYAMPRADLLPTIAFSTRHTRCTANPLGIKGAGEAGAIGAPPAVINALVDALQPVLGPVDLDMPATPDYLFARLRSGD